MTLKEALDTIAEYCRRHDCGDCLFTNSGFVGDKRYVWCKLQTYEPEGYDEIPIVETNMYDRKTIVENATVEILENTKTGETSVGWWKND